MHEPSHTFFANTACRYYPCHEELEEINCLFCFCPLYRMPHCPGSPMALESDGRVIRDCSLCTYPHQAENYDAIMACLAAR